MSDGRGESGKQYEQNNAKKKSGSDAYVQSVAKIAVAQVCESVGFPSFQQSALNMLSDVAVRYVCSIGKTANLYANLAGRAECNVFDVIQGLEDLGSQQGFTGASDINRCLAASGAVQEIIQYVNDSEEVPFVYSIPHFPIAKERKPVTSFAQVGESPPAEHIPAWLPTLPDHQTYVSALQTDREVVTETDNIETAADSKKAERPRTDLRHKLACNGAEVPSAVDPRDAAKEERAFLSNQFLNAPLQFVEKEVSSYVPARYLDEAVVQKRPIVENHVSALEPCDLAIDVVKSRLCESEEARKKVLLDGRPTVKFKFGNVKKSLVTSMSPRSEDNEKTTYWFENDNVKGDKKRRAEQILKESIEKTEEFAQL